MQLKATRTILALLVIFLATSEAFFVRSGNAETERLEELTVRENIGQETQYSCFPWIFNPGINSKALIALCGARLFLVPRVACNSITCGSVMVTFCNYASLGNFKKVMCTYYWSCSPPAAEYAITR